MRPIFGKLANGELMKIVNLSVVPFKAFLAMIITMLKKRLKHAFS
jgi:hypothetical protein